MPTFAELKKRAHVADHPLFEQWEQRVEKMRAAMRQRTATDIDLVDIFSKTKQVGLQAGDRSLNAFIQQAMFAAREALDVLDWPLPPKLTYNNAKHVKFARHDETQVVDAEILFNVRIATVTGVTRQALLPVAVSAGEIVPPSTLIFEDRMYVLGQSTINSIVNRNTSFYLQPLRSQYAPPLRNEELDIAVEHRNTLGYQPREFSSQNLLSRSIARKQADERAFRRYRCTVCGNEQPIATNHEGNVFDYCKGCSWKPSMGPSMNYGGRAFREFEFADEPGETYDWGWDKELEGDEPKVGGLFTPATEPPVGVPYEVGNLVLYEPSPGSQAVAWVTERIPDLGGRPGFAGIDPRTQLQVYGTEDSIIQVAEEDIEVAARRRADNIFRSGGDMEWLEAQLSQLTPLARESGDEEILNLIYATRQAGQREDWASAYMKLQAAVDALEAAGFSVAARRRAQEEWESDIPSPEVVEAVKAVVAPRIRKFLSQYQDLVDEVPWPNYYVREFKQYGEDWVDGIAEAVAWAEESGTGDVSGMYSPIMQLTEIIWKISDLNQRDLIYEFEEVENGIINDAFDAAAGAAARARGGRRRAQDFKEKDWSVPGSQMEENSDTLLEQKNHDPKKLDSDYKREFPGEKSRKKDKERQEDKAEKQKNEKERKENTGKESARRDAQWMEEVQQFFADPFGAEMPTGTTPAIHLETGAEGDWGGFLNEATQRVYNLITTDPAMLKQAQTLATQSLDENIFAQQLESLPGLGSVYAGEMGIRDPNTEAQDYAANVGQLGDVDWDTIASTLVNDGTVILGYTLSPETMAGLPAPAARTARLGDDEHMDLLNSLRGLQRFLDEAPGREEPEDLERWGEYIEDADQLEQQLDAATAPEDYAAVARDLEYLMQRVRSDEMYKAAQGTRPAIPSAMGDEGTLATDPTLLVDERTLIQRTPTEQALNQYIPSGDPTGELYRQIMAQPQILEMVNYAMQEPYIEDQVNVVYDAVLPLAQSVGVDPNQIDWYGLTEDLISYVGFGVEEVAAKRIAKVIGKHIRKAQEKTMKRAQNEGDPKPGAVEEIELQRFTPPAYDVVLGDMVEAEEQGLDSFPRSYAHIEKNYILRRVHTCSKDKWFPHLLNDGFILNPYGTNRGRLGAPDAQQKARRGSKTALQGDEEAVLEEALQVAKQHKGSPHEALQAADDYMNEKGVMSFGVEGMPYEETGPLREAGDVLYLNSGETYTPTVMYSDEEGFFISSWGDWLEEAERKHEEETGERLCPYCGAWSEEVARGEACPNCGEQYDLDTGSRITRGSKKLARRTAQSDQGRYLIVEKDGGNLKLTPTEEGIEYAREHQEGGGIDDHIVEMMEDFLVNEWDIVRPEQIGALTSALIFSDEVSWDDHGDIASVGRVYWNPNYQVENELETWANGDTVVFEGVE